MFVASCTGGGEGDGGLDLDICPGAPEFLVTPLPPRHYVFDLTVRLCVRGTLVRATFSDRPAIDLCFIIMWTFN